MIPPETLAELTQLRERVAYLEAELELLRDTKGKQIERLVQAFGITVGTARLLLVLSKGGILTRDQAIGLELSRVSDCDYRSLDSLIKRARQKLPWLRITTVYGLGYSLDDALSMKRIRAVVEGRQ